MSNLWLKVDVAPGADIKNTCEEAVSLADKIGIFVSFDFNGVTCIARPGDSSAMLEERWRKELTSPKPYKLASA